MPMEREEILYKEQYDEEEIDLWELLRRLISELPLIFSVALFAALLAGIISKFVLSPVYQSATEIYILEKQDKTIVTSSDLESGRKLTTDYIELIADRMVLEEVIHRMSLDLEYKELKEKVKVSSPSDTRVLVIKVEDEDPVLAMEIANEIRNAAVVHIKAVTDIEAVNVVTTANLPTEKSGPKVTSFVLLGGFSGGFLVIVILMAIYFLDDTIKVGEDVRKYLDTSVLAIIPLEKSDTSKGNRRRHKKQKKGIRKNSVNTTADFRVQEAYKTLRTNIVFSGSNVRVIGVTSCVPNEGKSSVSYELAVALAENGKSVVLVDADLRKSVLRKRFQRTKPFGLSHYLSGQTDLGQVVFEGNLPEMKVILAGPVPPNPSELLGSGLFQQMIEKLKLENEYVIIDTPPVGSVADGLVAAKVCDEMVMVLASGDISYRFAQSVKGQIEQVGAHLLGCVINKADTEMKGYYGKYYGGYYGKY